MLESYEKNQWKIFPCNAEKRPRTAGGFKDAKVGYHGNSDRIGLACELNGLVVVDVDIKNEQPGQKNWDELIEKHGPVDTLTARTQSGGWHYVFKDPGNVRFEQTLCKGIDLKWRGYIIVAPSPGYAWDNWGKEPAELPQWVIDEMKAYHNVEKKPAPKMTEGEIRCPMPYDEANVMLKRLVAAGKLVDYHSWRDCGMAIHDNFHGSDEGLELWMRHSDQDAHTQAICESMYQKFGSDRDTKITIGTLIERDKPLKKLEVEKATKDQVEKCWTQVDSKWITTPEMAIRWFNDQGCSIFSLNGKVMTVKKEKRVVSTQFIDCRGFTQVHAARMIEIFEDGEKVLKSASDYWLKHADRTTYEGLAFRPGGKPGCLNLWSGIPCEREEGDCTEILEFLENVICDGRKERYEYLLDWMAQLVQTPEKKSTVVPVIIGGQGCGKGLLTDGIMKGILGDLYLLLDDANEITAQFNERQSRKFLTVLDEATWGGSFQLANKLKRITGAESMSVEEKFGAKYSIDNFSRYIVTSNDIDTVKIEPGNRRFLVFETAQPRGEIYYSDMWDLIRGESSAIRRFYDFLMKRDIGKFNCYAFPSHLDTQGAGTKMASLAPVPRYICGLMFDNPKKLWHVKGDRLVVCVSDLYSDFLMAESTNRGFWCIKRFVGELEKFIPTLRECSKQTWVAERQRQTYHITPTDLRILCATRLRLPDVESIADTEYFDGKFEYQGKDF